MKIVGLHDDGGWLKCYLIPHPIGEVNNVIIQEMKVYYCVEVKKLSSQLN